MTRPTVAPIKVERHQGHMPEQELHHPAFGCVVVTQWHGGPSRMFGSDLVHNTGITVHIHESTMVRSLSSDRHTVGPVVCELNFTAQHWARLLSSIGNGHGVPCTFDRRRNGDLMACPHIEVPEATKREVHGKELERAVRERLQAMQAQIDRLGAMIDSGNIKKTELREMHRELARHAQQLPGSVQFVHDMFAESTEHLAEAAMAEVEAHVNGIATRLGFEHIRQMAPLLTDDSKKGGAA